jgi:hypothetical protein
MSINIELNSKEINIEICKNILKMLERRKVINTTDEIFDKIFNDINNKASLEFLLKDKTKCSIYIVNAKISSITQGTPIDDFLSNNLDIKGENSESLYKDDYSGAVTFLESPITENFLVDIKEQLRLEFDKSFRNLQNYEFIHDKKTSSLMTKIEKYCELK